MVRNFIALLGAPVFFLGYTSLLSYLILTDGLFAASSFPSVGARGYLDLTIDTEWMRLIHVGHAGIAGLID
jgi:hypothetical protein